MTVFERIFAGEIPGEILATSENAFALLDISPVNPGHVLIISKEPFPTLVDIPDPTLEEMILLAKKLAGAVQKSTGAEGFNLVMNNGEVAGQEVFHAHIHLIPRHKSDGHDSWHGKSYEEGEMRKMSSLIKQSLQER